MERPPNVEDLSRAEVIDYYVETLARVLPRQVSDLMGDVGFEFVTLQQFAHGIFLCFLAVRRRLRCAFTGHLGSQISSFVVILMRVLPESLPVSAKLSS